MSQDDRPDVGSESTQTRVRRFASLRAAQRALEDVVLPEELFLAQEIGRTLLRRLRGLAGDAGQAEILDSAGAVRGIDALLARLADTLRRAIVGAPIPVLCASLTALAQQESGALRALAALTLEGDLEDERTLDTLELLVVLMCCQGSSGRRAASMTPVEALPELARVDRAEIHESHPDLAEAEQILGRGVVRIARDDLGASRERIRRYKQRLGARRLNPDVLAALVAYDVSMGNRIAELFGAEDSLDAIAETVFGPGVIDREAVEAARARKALPLQGRPQAMRSRLFWQGAATFALSIGLLVMAVLLWQRPTVEVLANDSASDLSAHLVAGYVSGDDGTPRFVGTVGDSWEQLPLERRRLEVARIAARLESEGVRSVTLLDAHRAIQARHEDDSLLWIEPPAP